MGLLTPFLRLKEGKFGSPTSVGRSYGAIRLKNKTHVCSALDRILHQPFTMRISNILVSATSVALTSAWNTFVVPHSPGQDDAPAILAALPTLVANSSIVFKKGITYNIFTPIKFPVLNNVEVVIEGNLTYPTDISAIQGRCNSPQDGFTN